MPWERPSPTAYTEVRSMKKVYTTGQAAKICKVSQQTIIRCFDSGLLKGYRVPGSRFRRIPDNALLEFMREHGIPLDGLNGERLIRVLIVAEDVAFAERLWKKMSPDRFSPTVVTNEFDAGVIAKETIPSVIVVDCVDGQREALSIRSYLRTHDEFVDTAVIALVNGDSTEPPEAAEGIELLKKPFDPDMLAKHIVTIVLGKDT